MKLPGWAWFAAAGVVAAAFAWFNRFERVTVMLGPATLPSMPLVVVAFAAFLLGMAAMLLLSLPQDRRTRELLREHGLLDAPAVPRPRDPATRPAPSPDPLPLHADGTAAEP